MPACMYICMYTYIHIHELMQTCVLEVPLPHLPARNHYNYIHTYIYMYSCNVCMHSYMCVCIYIHTHIHTDAVLCQIASVTHACTHIYMLYVYICIYTLTHLQCPVPDSDIGNAYICMYECIYTCIYTHILTVSSAR
jgi:hypothetical protein